MQQYLWIKEAREDRSCNAKRNSKQENKQKNNSPGGNTECRPGREKKKDMLLLKEFNAHNPLWGSEKMSTRLIK